MNPFGATGSVIGNYSAPILKFPIRFHTNWYCTIVEFPIRFLTNVMKYIGPALSNI